jgi:peptidoglycan/LPS O-acetylase OafA/YrhL
MTPPTLLLASADVVRRRYLDLLRVLAILAVFSTHVISFCPPTIMHSLEFNDHNVSWLLIAPAWGGVWIFFALAGYLAGKGFASGRYALTWAGCRRFWWNRFLRICVPYYFAAFVVVVLTAPHLLDRSGWPMLARMLTFTYYDTAATAPLSQTWFVSTLVQLMVVAPLVALVLRPLLARPRLAVLIVGAVLLGGTLVRVAPLLLHPGTGVGDWWPSWMYVPVWANLDLFMAGYLLNAARACEPRADVRLRPAPVMALFAAVWVLTAWIAYHGLFLREEGSMTALAIGGPLVWLGMTALWVRMAETRSAGPSASGAWRLRGWLLVEAGAAVSYGVYLWHVPILQSVSTVVHASTPLGTWAVLFAVGLALTLGMAAATHTSVERAALRLRHEAPRGG